MNEWKIQGSRVYGNGQSYNCTNKVTAQQLYNTLTKYHQTTTLNKDIETKYDQITKQLIQIEMSMKILESEIKTLTELVKQ